MPTLLFDNFRYWLQDVTSIRAICPSIRGVVPTFAGYNAKFNPFMYDCRETSDKYYCMLINPPHNSSNDPLYVAGPDIECDPVVINISLQIH